tara:strand:+ start:5105 stop:5422 length:318 start_codon:yes stop_codon:yes gene_type:complete
MNKGDFLKEKIGNMARWVHSEVGGETLSADKIAGMHERSAVELMVFANRLHANKTLVDQRNWPGLGHLLAEMPEMQSVITEIQRREIMHDKFWRYMDLFVVTVGE